MKKLLIESVFSRRRPVFECLLDEKGKLWLELRRLMRQLEKATMKALLQPLRLLSTAWRRDSWPRNQPPSSHSLAALPTSDGESL